MSGQQNCIYLWSVISLIVAEPLPTIICFDTVKKIKCGFRRPWKSIHTLLNFLTFRHHVQHILLGFYVLDAE